MLITCGTRGGVDEDIRVDIEKNDGRTKQLMKETIGFCLALPGEGRLHDRFAG